LKIHCIACQTALELEADQISVNGSMVRCLMCSYIFMIFPPDCYGKPVTQDTNIDQSILDDLFEMQNGPKAQLSVGKLSEEGTSAMVDLIMSGEDFGDDNSSSVTDESEYADLPDLSELEKMIDWDDTNDLDEPPAKSNQDNNDPQGSIYNI
jgi:predicted Zn finger-like uncharacterized protein